MGFRMEFKPKTKEANGIGSTWNPIHTEEGFTLWLTADNRYFGPMKIAGETIRKKFTHEEGLGLLVQLMRMVGYDIPEDLKSYDEN